MPNEQPKPCPPDHQADAAWDQIMAIARENALVLSACGGVATLATPRAQREAGLRRDVLQTHCMLETPHVV